MSNLRRPFVPSPRLVGLALAATLPAGPVLAAPETGLIPSVATIDDGAALSINPAALGTDPGVILHLASGGFRSLAGQSYDLAVGLGGVGLGFRHEPTATGDRQELEFGTMIPLAPGFRSGLGYRFGRGNGRSGADYDFGLLMRPTDWLSLGAALRNAGGNVPDDPRSYQVGLGWRPLGDRLTLSLDTAWTDGQSFATSIPRAGLELEIGRAHV